MVQNMGFCQTPSPLAPCQCQARHRTFTFARDVRGQALPATYVAEARFSTVEFTQNAQHRVDEMNCLLVMAQTAKLKYSTTFTTTQSSQDESNTAKRAVLRDTRARRGFHVKVAAKRCHHEAKPRRETGIGHEPAIH
jgi:hypothetical protein